MYYCQFLIIVLSIIFYLICFNYITGHCSLVQSANLSINSSTDDSQTFISCLSGLYSGTYTVSAYDIESDGSRSKTESLTNDLAINGLSCPSPTGRHWWNDWNVATTTTTLSNNTMYNI